MAVTEGDVRHIAELARLGLDSSRIEQLVRELNGILAHMEVLSGVKSSAYEAVDDGRTTGLPFREDADGGVPLPLDRPREAFAPEMRDGFFLVPRLATHEDPVNDESP